MQLPPNVMYTVTVVLSLTSINLHTKLNILAQPYNRDGNIEFLALSKLEALANIPVLTAIEDNAEKFMDTAGSRLEHCFRSRKMRLAYEYIENWKSEKNPFHKPTWSGLLTVLGEIGLESLAKNIDDILKNTSSSVQQLDEHKDPA